LRDIIAGVTRRLTDARLLVVELAGYLRQYLQQPALDVTICGGCGALRLEVQSA